MWHIQPSPRSELFYPMKIKSIFFLTQTWCHTSVCRFTDHQFPNKEIFSFGVFFLFVYRYWFLDTSAYFLLRDSALQIVQVVCYNLKYDRTIKFIFLMCRSVCGLVIMTCVRMCERESWDRSLSISTTRLIIVNISK